MGRVFKFGNNIDTDAIVPGTSLNTTDPAELAKVCMRTYDPTLAAKIKPGDIFVAGKNFGCGSSREHAPLAIRAAGVSCVIAESFARIFYRNAINLGLPVLESADAAAGTEAGDQVEVDLTQGIIRNITRGTSFNFVPFSSNLMEIIQAGGLENYYLHRRGAR